MVVLGGYGLDIEDRKPKTVSREQWISRDFVELVRVRKDNWPQKGAEVARVKKGGNGHFA